MTISSVPFAVQGGSHSAALFRQAVSSVVPNAGGIVQAGDLAVTQTGTPSMGVLVGVGRAWVPGTNVANFSGTTYSSQAQYFALNDAPVTKTIAAADPTNPRIDIVVLQVNDAQYAGSTNDAELNVITGTPAASPTAPTAPANSLVLAQVAVAANATSIVNANITQQQTAGIYPNAVPPVYAQNTHVGTNNILTSIASHSLTPVIQAGSTVLTTNGTGDFTIGFPKAFPNGLICVVPSNGDNSVTGRGYTVSQGPAGPTLSQFFGSVAQGATALANTQVRIDWIAIGW